MYQKKSFVIKTFKFEEETVWNILSSLSIVKKKKLKKSKILFIIIKYVSSVMNEEKEWKKESYVWMMENYEWD